METKEFQRWTAKRKVELLLQLIRGERKLVDVCREHDLKQSEVEGWTFGKPDQLEVALMMAHTAQLTLPRELEQVFDMITTNAARAARLEDYGIAPGRRADLVILDASSVHEALRTQPPRRHVIHEGREVARATLSCELRLSPSTRGE